MSASGVSLSAAPVVPVPPPPGLNYVAAIEPSLQLLLVGTVFSSFLVPITIALFYFSTPAIRWRPVFILNAIAIALALAESAINIYNMTRSILVRPVSIHFNIAFECMVILVPLFTESILVFRVVAAYPPRLMSWRRCIAIYFPIAAFKISRLVINIIFAVTWINLVKHSADPLVAGEFGWNSAFTKVEWFLQVFDTTYVSILFLAKLQPHTYGRDRVVRSASTVSSTKSYSSRLRTLFWIATSNFVFPVLLNLAQLILVFRDRDFIHGTLVFLVNTYVVVIGVLLATVWSTSGMKPSEVELRRPNNGHTGTVTIDIQFADLNGLEASHPTIAEHESHDSTVEDKGKQTK
ncbi:hypothetical protein BV20DRAFT_1056099 [Pilatotrama ljubarskyi]|nr:hypothetical protein BV20DRAFT_1056099 [Pilatotrama ljubarskyi]